jgi:hypothetical protein
MTKTEASRYIEQVQGTIIGGDHVCGRLYYDGRPQGGQLSADTIEELRSMAKGLKDRYIAENNTAAYKVYPLDAWELRIFE